MSDRRKAAKYTTMLIANLVVTLGLIALLLWKSPGAQHLHLDTSIVILSALLNLVIVYQQKSDSKN